MGEHAWLVWGTRSSVAVGVVPFDRDFARKKKLSSAWNGALACQVYVCYDVLFLFFLSLTTLHSGKGILARNMIISSSCIAVMSMSTPPPFYSLDLRLVCLCVRCIYPSSVWSSCNNVVRCLG